MKTLNIDLSAIKLPIKGKFAFTSHLLKGLTFVVQPNGKSWSFRYTRHDGRRNSIVVGAYPQMDHKQAVETASAMRAGLMKGVDPSEQRMFEQMRRRQETMARGMAIDSKWRFSSVAVRFLDYCEKTIRASSVKKYRQSLNRNLLDTFGADDIRCMSISDYTAHIASISCRSSALQAHAAARAMFSFAVDDNLIAFNPLLGKKSLVSKLKSDPRTRYLSGAEIHRFLNELSDQPFPKGIKVALRLQLLTGLRIGEVTGLTWESIDIRSKMIRHAANDMKSGKVATTALSDAARRTLLEWKRDSGGKDGRLFAKGVDTASVVDALRKHKNWLVFCSHDIRRTVRSHLQRMGCPLEVRAAITNHSGQQGIARHYDHDQIFAQQLHWLTLWADALERCYADPNAFGDAVLPDSDDPLLVEFGDVL